MYPQGSLSNLGTLDTVIARLNAVRPDSPRQWGKMTPSQMLCHLSDALLVVMGDRPAGSAESALNRTVIKFIALHTPLPWLKDTPTGKEVDALRDGTKPDDFEQDRQRVIALLRRFAEPGAVYARHPVFGPMSRNEWMIWGFGHTDHHLRQFGV